MSMCESQQYIIANELTEDTLLSEGFICHDGYPVAFVKGDLSIQLLLPYPKLSKRPYYSAS